MIELSGAGRVLPPRAATGVERIARALCVSLLPDEKPCETCSDAAYRVYVKRGHVCRALEAIALSDRQALDGINASERLGR